MQLPARCHRTNINVSQRSYADAGCHGILLQIFSTEINAALLVNGLASISYLEEIWCIENYPSFTIPGFLLAKPSSSVAREYYHS